MGQPHLVVVRQGQKGVSYFHHIPDALRHSGVEPGHVQEPLEFYVQVGRVRTHQVVDYFDLEVRFRVTARGKDWSFARYRGVVVKGKDLVSEEETENEEEEVDMRFQS